MPMFGTAILYGLMSAGVVIALQGYLVIRGKRRPRAALFEKMLLEALALKTEAQTARVLGRLRVVYGFFLVAVALWGLMG
jgi:hypothetical protein